jgi:uncharacterized coiled-coil DUF342 family protein
MEQRVKVCCSCKVEKPTNEFYINKSSKDGLNYKCKICSKIYSKLNKSKPEFKEKQKEYNKKYYKIFYSNSDNKERVRNRVKNYNSKPENKKKILKRQNQYYKDRRKNDPEFRFYRMIIGHVRKVEKRDEFKNKWDEIKDIYDMYGITYHIDHLIPKSWFNVTTPKYIINHFDNLQVIDEKYNLCKQNLWSDKVCDEYLKIALQYIKKEYKNRLKKFD